MTICARCSYERSAGDTAPDWQCPNCGTAYAKSRPGSGACAGVNAGGFNPSPAASGPAAAAGAAPYSVHIGQIDVENVRAASFSGSSGGPVQGSFSFVVKLILLGALLLIVIPLSLRPFLFQASVPSPGSIDCDMRNQASCIDQKTGIMKAIPSLLVQGANSNAKPVIPCRLVGKWASGQNGKKPYKTRLLDDGTFTMEPGPALADGASGLWAVQGDKMIWRYLGRNRADINQVKYETFTAFTLTEENGRHTQFELLEAGKSTKCTP
jgi:hypothetical protein